MVKRIVLGFLAVLTSVFGAWLLYVGGAQEQVPRDMDVWGLFPGPLAFGIWCGGKMYTKDFILQLRLGGLGLILTLVATKVTGYLVSQAAVEGVAGEHLRIGAYGAVQLVVGLFLVGAAARSRWPVPETG
jgi:hypothetical protein